MDRLVRTVCAAAFALTAVPASAEVPAGKAATPATPATSAALSAEEANKRICRTYQSTGWRTRPARVCRTRAEWIELARRNEEDMRDLRRKRGGVE